MRRFVWLYTRLFFHCLRHLHRQGDAVTRMPNHTVVELYCVDCDYRP